jgi:hypothetical protein
VKSSPNITVRQEPEKAFPAAPAYCASSAHGEREGDGQSPSALLYLYSNNSIEQGHQKLEKEKILASCGVLTPYQKRQAHTLYSNADRFVSMAPSLDNIGFLTITTPDNCTDYKDLYRRWHSFNSNFLKKSPDFLHYLGVKERQQRGALHLHLLVQVNGDIRTGFDWENYLLARDLKKDGKPWRKVAAKCYRSATPYLAKLWPLLREELLKYGFGRSELLPIRSSVEAVSRYVGGYLGKHMSHREQWDKGMRLMFADRAWVKHSSRFQFLSEGSKEWREKVALFAAILKCATMKDIEERLGPRWCYRYREAICGIRETWAGIEEAPF